MDADERPLLSQLLLQAARQMLATEGKTWEVVGQEMHHVNLLSSLVASIGLGNASGLRGNLTIVGQPEFFRSIYPTEIAVGEVSDNAVAHWASEVANQLLGRIKNLLSGHAVNFSLGIPAVIRGDRMRLLCRDRPTCLEHSVRVDGHQLDLLLEMERSDGSKIIGADGEKMPTAAEGTSLLF
jgi:CheY-specific phosphatase CheX